MFKPRRCLALDARRSCTERNGFFILKKEKRPCGGMCIHECSPSQENRISMKLFGLESRIQVSGRSLLFWSLPRPQSGSRRYRSAQNPRDKDEARRPKSVDWEIGSAVAPSRCPGALPTRRESLLFGRFTDGVFPTESRTVRHGAKGESVAQAEASPQFPPCAKRF